MEAVKESIARGTPAGLAVRAALLARGLTVRAFAIKYGLPRSVTNHAMSGKTRASEAMIAALVEELGGTPEDWRETLWLAGKPAHLGAVRVRHAS